MQTKMKRADELQPGDILVGESRSRNVVLRRESDHPNVRIVTAMLGPVHPGFVPPPSISSMYAPEHLVRIESHDLTPAQQHADELLCALSLACLWFKSGEGRAERPGWYATARKLLDEINPPKPPTVRELVQALDRAKQWIGTDPERYDNGEADSTAVSKEVDDLLNRARRAGMIGGAE